MQKLLIYLFVFCFPLTLLAASPAESDSLKLWNYEGTTALNFSQVSFTNWAAGGQSSISAMGLLKFNVNYKDSSKVWNNSLDMAFGVIRQGDVGNLAKSDDRIELNTSYGWNAFKKWYYNMSLNLKSQAAAGYKTPTETLLISDFLAPAYMTISVGMSHNDKESGLDFQLLPLSGKITYVNNQDLADAGAFGVDPALMSSEGIILENGSKLRTEFGGVLKFQYKNEVLENVTLQSKASLFSNYKVKALNIDVNWELLVLMKINKYLTANINSHLIYDEDIDIALDFDNDGVFESSGPRTQFKELFGLGLSYSF